jgi:Arc/MetJ-type ribon-helix-helix transcriptional regulator
MYQVKISLESTQLEFIAQHKVYGFKDRSAMVRTALQQMQERLERERLMASADLYAELYDADEETQALTDAALEGWPE